MGTRGSRTAARAYGSQPPNAASRQIRCHRLICLKGGCTPAVKSFMSWQRRLEMLDAILLIVGCAFFVLSIGYVAACEKL
jgi:hypothetical protein